MVTTVVRNNPIPEYGNSGSAANIGLPGQGSLLSMNLAPFELEESKASPRLAAPKSLAPIASKSKATLEPMDSKLSRALN